MLKSAAALVFAGFLCTCPARAEDGYWLSLEADDGTKAGLVFPDFQPNNFSVFWMACPEEKGPASLIVEFPVEGLREGASVPVVFTVDDDALQLEGRGVKDEFQGTVVIEIELDANDGFFDRLAKAEKIVIKAGEVEFPTPIKGAWSAINNFTNLCRAR